MITASNWQRELSEGITHTGELLEALGLPGTTVADRGALNFPLRVPRSFVARMRRGDPADPLLRQVLPVPAERSTAPGYTLDPLGETLLKPLEQTSTPNQPPDAPCPGKIVRPHEEPFVMVGSSRAS